MTQPLTDFQMEKLPKWACAYIKNINSERDLAVRELNSWVDNQTKTPFFRDEMIFLYQSAWVLILQRNGSWVIARMD